MPDLIKSVRPLVCFLCISAAFTVIGMAGCASWWGTEPVIQNEFVNHYKQVAENVAQLDPTIESPKLPPSLGPGRDLTEPKLDERWLLTLTDALRMGIENNAIIRQNGQFLSPNNPVLRSPDSTPSIYDSDIQNAGVLFGSRGIDAALSDYDPRFTTTLRSGNDQTVSNSTIQSPPQNILENNFTQIQMRYEQQFLSGGTLTVNENWSSSLSNQPNQLFNNGSPTSLGYTGLLGAEFRQPLWSGAGREFTSIAGPSTQRARGFSLVSQGIVIAHINKRLSEIDFQENVQNFAREIGELYWDLYQNYQDYESERATSSVAKELWDRMTNRQDLDPGADVAQAEDAYFESKAREEQALSNLFITEAKLRRLLGVPIDDPRMIYPCDEPREEEIQFNRSMCLFEALVNRIELTRQKTNLHSLQLQLSAARNLVAPKLDFVSGYALNGFGNNFYSPNSRDVNGTQFNSALSNLFTGRETSWSAGFEYSIPLWLRQEKAQVRQLELRIVKARATLAAQEDEIAHELNTVLMTIRRAHSMSKFNRRRLQAAEKRVLATRSEYEAGSKSNDLLLRALTSRTQARVAYARSITEYNKNLRDLLFRTGHLLTEDGINLIGIDGLPLAPPPSPENPFQELPKPSAPDVPPSPDSDTPEGSPDTDPAPKPKKSPRIAESDDETLSALPVDFDADLPRLPDEESGETSDERQPKQKLRLRDNFADAPDEFDREIVPASGSRQQ